MTETTIVIVITTVGVAMAAIAGFGWARLRDYRRTPGRIPAALPGPAAQDFLSRYQPLIRLMAGGDADFLNRRVKCPSFMSAWERTRRRLVRLYLHELAADFVRLHRQAREMVAQSPEQFSELVPILFRQQWAFWRALLWIEARLTLAALGVPKMRIPKLSPDGLLGPLEVMQRAIAQPGAPA